MNAQLQAQAKAGNKSSDVRIARITVKRRFSSQRGFSAGATRYPIQAKLKIGQPGDKCEQEADRVADQVMRMPEPAGKPPKFPASEQPPIIQRKCPECEEELNRKPILILRFPQSPANKIQRRCTGCGEEIQRQSIEEEEEIQRKSAGGYTPPVTQEINEKINRLRGGGQPLSQSTRSFFEPRFGYDFRDVRIHADSDSSDTAKLISARAFAFGNNVVMGEGEYQPHSSTGKRLLGHELTHVVQQNARSNAVHTRKSGISTHSNAAYIQRVEPVTTTAAGITFGAVVAKCIVGAIVGVLFDGAIQAILHSIKNWTWRFWRATWDYCSMILSAILGCIAAPISAAILEPWIVARLGTRLGRIAGTLLGKILLFIAKKLAIGIPIGIVKSLAKLGCISSEQANELGVTRQSPEEPAPKDPDPEIPVTPGKPEETKCKPKKGNLFGDVRILMKVNTTDFLDSRQEVNMDKFSDSLRGTGDKVLIHGLASVDGPSDYNEKLSCRRSLSAEKMLLNRGILSNQIADLFKHGEVPGDYQQQRSVVLERIGKAGRKPEVPKPKPGKPSPPKPVAPSPQAGLKSLHFLSDHGKLKNNKKNWDDIGALYKEPEWLNTTPDGVSAPISHTKGKKIKVAVTVNFVSAPQPGVPIVLKGEGPQGFLTFRVSGSLDGKKEQVFVVDSNSSIPNEIAAYLNQMIVWSIHVHNETKLIGISAGHDIFSTYTMPKGGVTYKRMITATGLARGFGNQPHDIVSGQMARFPEYNLDRAYENSWKVADDIKTAADCQTIVRFIQVVNNMVGLPGTSRGLSIFADPYGDPTVPKHGVLTPKGGIGMHNFSPQPGTGYKAGLFDDGDNQNNYEAALEFKYGGKLLYYPGGVTPAGKGVEDKKGVLYVFKQMAWGEYDPVARKILPRVAIYCYRQKKSGPCN